ncbi:MAG: hypothetical protein QXG39_08500 [Candidatus Aenigmatarchaeota archaeon]
MKEIRKVFRLHRSLVITLPKDFVKVGDLLAVKQENSGLVLKKVLEKER